MGNASHILTQLSSFILTCQRTHFNCFSYFLFPIFCFYVIFLSTLQNMSLTRQLAHNTVVQIVGKIVSTFLGLVAIGMITRYLGQEQFGWYITTMSFLQFIGILVDFGMIPVTAQMLSEPAFDKTKLFQNIFTFRFVTALVFLGLSPIAALFFPYPAEVKMAIGFTTISFLSIALNQVFTGLYQTKLKMHIQVLSEIAGRIALVAGLWLIMAGNLSFLWLMGAVTVASVMYTVLMAIEAHRLSPLRLSFDKTMWHAIAIKMWPIAISIIFNVVYLKGDLVLLSIMRPQAEVGIYGAAYRVIDILTQTAMLLMGVMLPLLAFAWSRNLKDQFRRYLQQSFDVMMILAIPMVAGLLVLARPIMVLVAGEEFAVSGVALQILAFAVFGVYLGGVFGHVAVAINKQKKTMWVYISGAIMTLIGYLYFIPIYGMWGAAWMSVFSELYVGLLLWLVIRTQSHEIIRLKTLGKVTFASVVMGLVLWPLRSLPVMIPVVLGMVIYSVLLFATRAISPDTVREVLSRKSKVIGG